MIQFRDLNSTGRGGEDDYLHDSVEGLGRYMQRTKDNCLDGVVNGSVRGDLLDGPAMIQLRAFNGTCRGGDGNCHYVSVMIQLRALNGGENYCLDTSVMT